MRRARSRSTRCDGRGIRAFGICRTTTSTSLPSIPEPDSYGFEVSHNAMPPTPSSASPPCWANQAVPLVTSPSWYCSGSPLRISAGVLRELRGA